MQKTIELLAPAKDLACGITAINCGADAVYIGAEYFSARGAAANSLQDIEQLVNYAHRYWAKVYVALNTIMTDPEIPVAVKLINDLYNVGVDALIIQDMGLLECALPPIPLFASTQCDNRTPGKVKFLEDCGFKRVILARELSLKDIQNIRKYTKVDLECFVQGALCVSYSGQCYLSQALGGRSANRGECAQPCRKLYSLATGKGKYLVKNKHLLSLKDLSLANHLKQLVDAGITSFKIEGRLKDEMYVKNVVGFYRQKIDELQGVKKISSGIVSLGFTPDLKKTFNRDYTDYNITGKLQNYTSFDTPKHRGEEIGNIKELNPADGITYYDENGELQGDYVNRMEIPRTARIYRNYDYLFHKNLKSAKTTRSVLVSAQVTATEESLVLTLTDEDQNVSTTTLQKPTELANDQTKALAILAEQLQKTGGTEFSIKDIKINLAQLPFLPIKEVNAWRRDALEALRTVRLKNYPKKTARVITAEHPYPQTPLDFRANVLNEKAKQFYNRHGAVVREFAAESGLKLNGKPAMEMKHCLYRECLQCGSKEILFLIDDRGRDYQLVCNPDECTMRLKL